MFIHVQRKSHNKRQIISHSNKKGIFQSCHFNCFRIIIIWPVKRIVKFQLILFLFKCHSKDTVLVLCINKLSLRFFPLFCCKFFQCNSFLSHMDSAQKRVLFRHHALYSLFPELPSPRFPYPVVFIVGNVARTELPKMWFDRFIFTVCL